MAFQKLVVRATVEFDVDHLVALIREQVRIAIAERADPPRRPTTEGRALPVRPSRPHSEADQPWIDVRDLTQQFGMTHESIKNAILADRFPIPAFKLGRRVVVDRNVLDAYFKKQEEDGIRELEQTVERPRRRRASRNPAR